jgi:endophilin-A
MAFLPGLKKQFNKANQFMSERITGVEGTKLDSDFTEMERRTDLFNELVEDLQVKTKEYLQVRLVGKLQIEPGCVAQSSANIV